MRLAFLSISSSCVESWPVWWYITYDFIGPKIRVVENVCGKVTMRLCRSFWTISVSKGSSLMQYVAVWIAFPRNVSPNDLWCICYVILKLPFPLAASAKSDYFQDRKCRPQSSFSRNILPQMADTQCLFNFLTDYRQSSGQRVLIKQRTLTGHYGFYYNM